MKTNAYKLTIVILLVCLGFVVYLINSNDSENTSTQTTQTSNDTNSHLDNNAVDIKELKNTKNTKKTDITAYTPEKIDNTQANEKLSELQEQLSKTEKLIKEYNKSNPNTLLKNQDISSILSLEQKRIEKNN